MNEKRRRQDVQDDFDSGRRFFTGIINSIWITASIGALAWMIWRIFA